MKQKIYMNLISLSTNGCPAFISSKPVHIFSITTLLAPACESISCRSVNRRNIFLPLTVCCVWSLGIPPPPFHRWQAHPPGQNKHPMTGTYFEARVKAQSNFILPILCGVLSSYACSKCVCVCV